VGRQTGIARAHHTRSPWWVYAAVSPACQHCHAAACAARVGWPWGTDAPRRVWPHDAIQWHGLRRRVGAVACRQTAAPHGVGTAWSDNGIDGEVQEQVSAVATGSWRPKRARRW